MLVVIDCTVYNEMRDAFSLNNDSYIFQFLTVYALNTVVQVRMHLLKLNYTAYA